ncbi:hypothetical protein B0A48_18440 [Cryoendolithus antarcticus]|uniref:AAA+ ATPase domain-containing protein n=1 Tax=Cryoendolithus antarcticus TaxID=1507870 RepID=A0A1V8S8C4_9PEZI|nr:hypothetical protein B0A48_18440 [Cryoendolithus antarcticus]
MADKQFTVRKAPAGLREAYRVFLDAGALTKLGLATGTLCEVHQDDLVGIGIAWRGSDSSNSPKNPPVQMSEIMRDTFSFQLGKNVRIQKSTQKITEAARIELVDVTPSEYEIDSGSWQHRCMTALFDDNCEAVAVGMTFDVAAKKGLRKRYFVEHIECHGSAPQSGPALYTVGDSTEFVFTQGMGNRNTEMSRQLNIRLDAARIGGLQAQIEDLNRRLTALCGELEDRNAGILLHGYEGTGKSLLLNEVAHSFGRERTFRLFARQLLGTASGNSKIIDSTFGDASASQPSVIIIDDLHEMAASGDALLKPTAAALSSAIDKVQGTSVLVVAAARSISSVQSCLIPHFLDTYELPIPDAAARLQIMKVLLGRRATEDSLKNVAARTHGFTGSDLKILVGTANVAALKRHIDEGWVRVDLRPSPQSEDTSTTLVDGAAHSRVASLDDRQETTSNDSNITMPDLEVALAKVRPTALREIILEVPKVTWDDIGGSETLKARFDQIIGWPLYHAGVLAEFNRTNWQKSVLLYGPPGCSKTMTAQAVANTYGLNFLAVKGAELLSMYVGESERAVREIFRKAKAAAPSIIFFDEIDAVGSSRDAGGDGDLHVLTTLLNEMDGFTRLKGVQVMAATNKPQSLDPALLRPGRFDAHFYLAPPHEDARRDIIELQLKGIQRSTGLDTAMLARAMDGFSGAEMVGICDLAVEAVIARAISSSGERCVTAADFEAAIGASSRGITGEMLEVYDNFGARGKRA